VDNRVFLLGLDLLYREVMKEHEREELLGCARRVAEVLHVTPANVPIEGYYAEDEQLTEYFRLIRALQMTDKDSAAAASSLPELQRLLDVTSAPLYGRAQYTKKLLPTGRNALSQALLDTKPDWTVKRLTAAAYNAALMTDDISLVGLAARVKDPVVLAAAGESVVLFTEMMFTGLSERQPPKYEYVWKVDEDLAEHARRFIDTFNTLFGEELPPPDEAQAEHYWRANDKTKIRGRCVRLGYNNTVSPPRHYHWGICRDAGGKFVVQEFWKPEVWTTKRYRSTLEVSGRCPEL
jgi:hypothetical protein